MNIKKNTLALVTTIGLLGATSAQASTITNYTDNYNADDITLSATGTDSDSWIFDITTDGFDPVTEDVLSATILLEWDEDDDDDGEYGDDPEEHKSGTVTLANLTVGTENFSNVLSEVAVTVGLTSIVTLSETGQLSATLSVISGELEFETATLVAITEEITAVPIPAAAWLFGSGLLGLFGIARRQK